MSDLDDINELQKQAFDRGALDERQRCIDAGETLKISDAIAFSDEADFNSAIEQYQDTIKALEKQE